MSEIHLLPKYRYRAFGITLLSDFELPELESTVEQEADVTISTHSLPASLHGGDNKDFHFSAGFNYFYLQIKNVAKYLIIDGCRITIDPYPGTTEEQVRLYLLGTSMGVLLYQRGFLPLHGSGIATPNGCTLFLGKSGIGKSTLAAALSKHSFKILTDDICALFFRNSNEIEVHPSYPQLKLCQDSTETLKIPLTALTKTSPDLNKFVVKTTENFQKTSLRLANIFILGRHDSSDICIEQIKGVQKFTELTNNIYRGNLIEKLQLTEQQFRQCSQLCKNISSVFRVVRPEKSFSLEQLTTLLLQYL